MAGQKLRYLLRILLLPVHAQAQRLDAAQQKKGIERPQSRAFRVLQEADFMGERGVFHHNRARGHVAVSAQKFGGGVHHDIRAQVERVLQIRRHQTVIHREQSALPVGRFRQRGDIDDAQQRVGRRFNVHQPRLRRDQGREGLHVRGVAVTHVDPAAIEHLGERAVAAAVEIVPGQHFVVRAQQPAQRGNGRHAAGETEGAVAVFQIGDLFFQHGARRVAAARIIVLAKLRGRFLLEGGRLIDGRSHRTPGIARTSLVIHQSRRQLHAAPPC